MSTNSKLLIIVHREMSVFSQSQKNSRCSNLNTIFDPYQVFLTQAIEEKPRRKEPSVLLKVNKWRRKHNRKLDVSGDGRSGRFPLSSVFASASNASAPA